MAAEDLRQDDLGESYSFYPGVPPPKRRICVRADAKLAVRRAHLVPAPELGASVHAAACWGLVLQEFTAQPDRHRTHRNVLAACLDR